MVNAILSTIITLAAMTNIVLGTLEEEASGRLVSWYIFINVANLCAFMYLLVGVLAR